MYIYRYGFFFLTARSNGGSWHRRRRRTKVEVDTYARNLIHIYSTCIYTPKQDRQRQRSRGNSDGEVVTYERNIYLSMNICTWYVDMKMSPFYTDTHFKTTLPKNDRWVRSEKLKVNKLVIVQHCRKRARRTK